MKTCSSYDMTKVIIFRLYFKLASNKWHHQDSKCERFWGNWIVGRKAMPWWRYVPPMCFYCISSHHPQLLLWICRDTVLLWGYWRNCTLVNFTWLPVCEQMLHFIWVDWFFSSLSHSLKIYAAVSEGREGGCGTLAAMISTFDWWNMAFHFCEIPPQISKYNHFR